jgi:transcriptional regulator with XRE-family HTH domain
MPTLAARLQAALSSRHPPATQAELAKACGVRAPSVSDWFSGETKALKANSAAKAAAFLQVRLEWLLYGVGPMRALGEADHAYTVALPEPASSLEQALPSVLQALVQLSAAQWQMVRTRLDHLVAQPEDIDSAVADLMAVLSSVATEAQRRKRAA